VELSIKEFPVMPVSFKGRYYKRVNNSNHLLSLTEIADMHLKTFNNSWDSYATNDYTFDDISIDKVTLFIENCNKLRDTKIEDDPFTVLNKFELLRESKIVNACHLLFAKGEVFKATIELGRFASPILIKDALTLRTDLFSEVEAVFNFIKKHLNKSFIITGNTQREERWQYPLDAIREIIVNMIVHRDYMHHGDSSIKIYDNSIEFFNPGNLPDTITIQQLVQGNYVSQTRNKKLAAMFKEAGFIEKYGSGIKRIQQQFIAYGLQPPLFENFQHGFRVLVFANEYLIEKVVDNVVNDVVDNVVEKVVDNVEDKVLDKDVDTVVEKAIDYVVDKAVDTVVEKGVNTVVEKVVDEFEDKVVDKAVDTVVEKGVNTVVEKVVDDVEDKVVDKAVDTVVEKGVITVVDIEQQILELIKQNNKLPASEIASKLSVAARTIQRHFKNLQLKGEIVRIGAARGGYWKVVN
jgi:ATP-dependent DNA helicase RecG